MESFVPRGFKLFGLGMFAIAFLSFGSIAKADEVSFARYTNGCFGPACAPPNTNATQIASLLGLTYSNSMFNGTPAGSFLTIGETTFTFLDMNAQNQLVNGPFNFYVNPVFGIARGVIAVSANITVAQQSPVTSAPEPATMVLLGTSLLGIGAKLRKDRTDRRKQNDVI